MSNSPNTQRDAAELADRLERIAGMHPNCMWAHQMMDAVKAIRSLLPTPEISEEELSALLA
jgi:hypothetical protein